MFSLLFRRAKVPWAERFSLVCFSLSLLNRYEQHVQVDWDISTLFEKDIKQSITSLVYGKSSVTVFSCCFHAELYSLLHFLDSGLVTNILVKLEAQNLLVGWNINAILITSAAVKERLYFWRQLEMYMRICLVTALLTQWSTRLIAIDCTLLLTGGRLGPGH